MGIDFSVILVTVLNVLILFWFLKKKLFVPVTNFMNNRTETIEKKIEEAETMMKQAQDMKAQYEIKLTEAESEGKRIVQEYKDKAQSLSDDILKEANREAELIRVRGRNDAEREREKVEDEVKRNIITLALLAASKAVEGQMDSKKQHVLIKQFISKVGS